MRIGIEAASWQNTRGYGRHARALFGSLVDCDPDNQYVFFLDSPGYEDSIPSAAEVRIVASSTPASLAAAADGRRSLMDMWRMSRALSAPEYDLLIFPTVYSYVPVFSRAKKIVLIHDIIAETFPQLTLPTPSARLFWRAKVALGRRQAHAVVTVSEYARRGIASHFNMPLQQVHVVGEASDPVFRLLDNPQPTLRMQNLGITSTTRTVIFVGGFGPHKNLDQLVSSFAKLVNHDQYSDVKLIMVGEYKKEVFHSEYHDLEQKISALGIGKHVLFTGFLPDENLVTLLNLGTVLVLPSLMEGFGLPAVEAAACGCPVIATTASPLPELLGEGGIFVDPNNQVALENALETVLSSASLRKQLRTAGLTAARNLTWDAAAQQMVSIINTISQV